MENFFTFWKWVCFLNTRSPNVCFFVFFFLILWGREKSYAPFSLSHKSWFWLMAFPLEGEMSKTSWHPHILFLCPYCPEYFFFFLTIWMRSKSLGVVWLFFWGWRWCVSVYVCFKYVCILHQSGCDFLQDCHLHVVS